MKAGDLRDYEQHRPVDYNAGEAKYILSNAEGRIVNNKHRGYQLEILVDGKWLMVSRTDLHDDVGTTFRIWNEHSSIQEIRNFYFKKIRLGARKNEKYFCVIDAFSDG